MKPRTKNRVPTLIEQSPVGNHVATVIRFVRHHDDDGIPLRCGPSRKRRRGRNHAGRYSGQAAALECAHEDPPNAATFGPYFRRPRLRSHEGRCSTCSSRSRCSTMEQMQASSFCAGTTILRSCKGLLSGLGVFVTILRTAPASGDARPRAERFRRESIRDSGGVSSRTVAPPCQRPSPSKECQRLSLWDPIEGHARRIAGRTTA